MPDYKGEEADRLVTRIDPGVVSLANELRGHERHAAEELGQWKTHHEEPKPLDASSAAITLAMLMTDGLVGEEGWRCRNRAARTTGGSDVAGPQPAVRHGEPAQVFPANTAPPDGRLLNAVVCSRVHGLQEALSAGTIALEISSRNSRVAALQNRWDRLRAGLDLILDQRAADMADLPSGSSGLLCLDYKGKEATTEATPAWSRCSPNSAVTSARLPRNWSGGRPTARSVG